MRSRYHARMQKTPPFTPPGPGVWVIEGTHIVRPVSRWFAEVFPNAMMEGFRFGTSRYCLLLDYLEMAVVNSFVYSCARAVGAPKNAKGPPPKLMFKLITKLHPEVRRRIKGAAEVFASRRWREDLARWDNEWKPAIARENTEFQRIDPRTLSDEELVAHLERCRDLVHRAVFRHHSLNIAAMLPLGDLLAHMQEWTGLTPSDVLPVFRGSSRVSLGAVDELNALVQAIGGNKDVLNGNDPAAVIDALTKRDDAIGEAARTYVDAVGVRVATGYDVADLTIAEMPDVLLGAVRAAVSNDGQRSADDVAKREHDLRMRVPEEHRETFNALLHEARLTYRLRDERGYLNDAWSTGIARRAILAAGERLVAKGRLHEAEHAVDLSPSEIVNLLQGGNIPDADDVAARTEWRTTATLADAPQFLGGVPAGPPPADWLPPAAARIQRATDVTLNEMFAAQKNQDAKRIKGFPASPGEVSGVARLVLDPKDMARVRKGDLLVTKSTAPSYNALLPLIRGIVTDRGGTLSHAALVAREYGIPAVVGCGNATEMIRDGANIRIDGTNGSVEVLA
jgi:rifampicin phosphotransferase